MKRKLSVYELVLIALLADLTAAGAFIRIPMGYSSFTLQLFFTFMAGILLGAEKGALSQLLYLFIGLAGLPVFTGGGGPGYLLQPTFGFLLGLAPAAWAVGMIAGKSGSLKKVIPACLAGTGIVYLIGIPYMALILNGYMGKDIPFLTLITSYMLPFLPFDALKTAAAALAAKPALAAIERIGNRAGIRAAK